MGFTASATAMLAFGLLAALAASVTPVEKVIELLHGMQDKAEKAKQEEVVQWSAYKRWCSDAEYDRQNLVKAADLELASLRAAVEKHDLEAHRLSQLIVGHQNGIINFQADIELAQGLRVNESKAHTVLHEDYSESIHAITQAIKVLKEQDYKLPQAVALLQHLQQRAGLLLEARQKVEAFLAQASERADVASFAASGEPGEAHGYEFQSGGIVQMLQDLLTQFQTDLTTMEKEELTRRHATERQVLDLNSQISSAENEIMKNTKHEAEHTQASADAHAKWTDLDAIRTDDKLFLADLHTSCNQKQIDFEARQQLRQEEVEALQKAVGILSSEKVAGHAQTHLPTLVQSARHAASFLQLGRASKRPAAAAAAPQAAGSMKERTASAAAYLQRAGNRMGSEVLTVLAARVQAGSGEADVFEKVREMISGLIARLQAEEGEEASHKEWCDREMGTNEQTRTTKSTLVDELHGTIEQTTSKIAKLNQDVAELSKAVATLAKEMAEALRLRDDERNQNEGTIADAVEGRMAVGQAITILQNYYGQVAQGTVLAQRGGSAGRLGQAPQPPIFSKVFKGQQTENDNIIAFLQVIQSDFARLESETGTAETTAQSQYQIDSAAALADKQAKEGSITAKNNQQVIEKASLQTASNDLDLAQADLSAALAYYDKLKPSCVGPSAEVGYKARVERREGELESLKEALSILNGQTLVSGPESLYSSVDGGNRGMDVGITADKA